MNPLLDLGYERQLELTDFFKLPPEQETSALAGGLEAAWFSEVQQARTKGRTPSLTRVYWSVFHKMILFGPGMFFLEACTQGKAPLSHTLTLTPSL